MRKVGRQHVDKNKNNPKLLLLNIKWRIVVEELRLNLFFCFEACCRVGISTNWNRNGATHERVDSVLGPMIGGKGSCSY